MDIHKFVDAVLLMKTRYGVVEVGVSDDTFDRLLVHMEEWDRNVGVRPQIAVGDLRIHGIPIKRAEEIGPQRAAPKSLAALKAEVRQTLNLPPRKPRTLAEDLPGSY